MKKDIVLNMLNQAKEDRDQLAQLLSISNEQIQYVTDVPAGQSLMRIGSSLVPFINKYTTNTQIFKLMSTKPCENQ
ncbi:MAG: hypothetical protein K6F88_07460 [Ruminococcus sp.]|nr:hypothetical protein [Ruminococcus sp.]